MSNIFDEKNMIMALEKYIPEGETLAAGIHGIGLNTEVRHIFGKCILVGEQLMPDKDADAYEISKCKYAKYDVYIGITEHYLILSECEVYKHYYEFNDSPDLRGRVVEEINTCIPLENIGTCFPLAEIQKCEIKKVWMGAVNCSITMKNGSFLKLQLPKRGGLGGGMPHHAEYRERILECLGGSNA